MPITKIYPASHFVKTYKKLPENIKIRAKQQEKKFIVNPFDTSLKTHKLKGELEGFWSYSVNYQYRILFRFIKGDEVLYYDIGTHEIYR
ncbi:MAG: type II toxin-antitoxin system RelE/ParE family toxin [Elusimicrobiota bacterium]|nr:type II toxin-antitoxin system RelE/ParE family toxin [Elusimicrobiota bacterium]